MTTVPVVIDSTGATVSGGRIDPSGITPFSITLKKSTFTSNTNFQVSFVQAGGLSVSTTVQGKGSATISGTAPVNHTYLGPVKTVEVDQLDSSGNPITPPVLQSHGTGFYYALPKPLSVTSVSGSVPASGGSLTISGSGFQTWPLNPPGGGSPTTVNPIVVIGTATKANPTNQVSFTVSSCTPPSAIQGTVGPTPSSIATCSGGTPCKLISVINPGGSFTTDDNLTSSSPLLTISPPNAPTVTVSITSPQGNGSNTLGVSVVQTMAHESVGVPVQATIMGTDLSLVTAISFSGSSQKVPFIVTGHGTIIKLSIPPVSASQLTTNSNVSLAYVGSGSSSVSAGTWIYTATAPIPWEQPPFPSNEGEAQFIVGPGEKMSITQGPQSASCSMTCPALTLKTPSFILGPVLGISSANLGTALISEDCSGCSEDATSGINVQATNTTIGATTAECVSVSCQPSEGGCGVGWW